MIRAILYHSLTGSCERYAREMSRRLALPLYPVDHCPLPKGIEILYIGWLMNGKVSGLEKARRRFDVRAVVQVGMSAPSARAEAACREKNGLADDVAVFTVQGGFHMAKLPLPLRLVMKAVNRSIVQRLQAQGDLSPAEQATLSMARSGEGEPASWDGIQAAIDWAVAETRPPEVIRWHEPS